MIIQHWPFSTFPTYLFIALCLDMSVSLSFSDSCTANCQLCQKQEICVREAEVCHEHPKIPHLCTGSETSTVQDALSLALFCGCLVLTAVSLVIFIYYCTRTVQTTSHRSILTSQNPSTTPYSTADCTIRKILYWTGLILVFSFLFVVHFADKGWHQLILPSMILSCLTSAGVFTGQLSYTVVPAVFVSFYAFSIFISLIATTLEKGAIFGKCTNHFYYQQNKIPCDVFSGICIFGSLLVSFIFAHAGSLPIKQWKEAKEKAKVAHQRNFPKTSQQRSAMLQSQPSHQVVAMPVHGKTNHSQEKMPLSEKSTHTEPPKAPKPTSCHHPMPQVNMQ